MEYVIGLLVVIVIVLVIVQVLIRKHYIFGSRLDPASALRAAAGAIGGGESYFDASGALSIPLGRGRILSVAAEPQGTGSKVEVWLSSYDFINANGFAVIGYQGKAKRIMRACAG